MLPVLSKYFKQYGHNLIVWENAFVFIKCIVIKTISKTILATYILFG